MIYDANAPVLVERGYYPLPTAPADFEPAKSPVRWIPSLNQFRLLQGWNTRPAPILTPEPGANIGVRCGNGLIGFDYDDEDAALVISEVFPASLVNKVGQRGWTAFYFADFEVPSEDYFDSNGKKVFQILSDGRQTVLPPSIHPDTKEQYRWTNGRSLYDTPPNELTPLPHDYRERILKLGYSPKRDERPVEEVVDPETGEINAPASVREFEETPHSELNAIAIKNLSAWVPELNIYKCRRRSGRIPTYEGVAQWRDSTTGTKLEERNLDLSISTKGITDFGVDRGYSPLDLVMAARSCSLSEAFDWLEMRVMKKSGEIEIDLDKIVEAQGAPEADASSINDGDADPDSAWVGKEWEDGDPVPAPLPMLIPYFVPLEPYLGYLWGQSQTYKTFLLNTMAVAVASGTYFAGQRVTARGLVYQVELEGSRSQLRIQAAKQFAGITERLPIVHVTKTPPALIGAGKRVSNDWKKWASAIVRKAKAAAERWSVPLKLITIDPQNHFAGFTDEQSSAEGNLVCNALIAMAKEAGCPVLVADHLGKDPAAGGRGTSVKHQSPWFILDAGQSAEELGEDRVLIIRKMKDGEDGLGVSFHMEKFSAEIDQETRGADGVVRTERASHDTLIVVFEGEVKPVNTIKSDTENRLTDKEMIVLNTISSMLNGESAEH